MCFVLSSLNVAVVANSVFHLWGDDVLPKVWKTFMDVPWTTPKKYLYILLALQLMLYFMMVVNDVDWAMLLVVIMWIYLGSGQRSFMIMYLTIIVNDHRPPMQTDRPRPPFARLSPEVDN